MRVGESSYERSRAFAAPLWGVRASGGTGDLPTLADAALLLAPNGSAISGRAAAQLYGLPLPAPRRHHDAARQRDTDDVPVERSSGAVGQSFADPPVPRPDDGPGAAKAGRDSRGRRTAVARSTLWAVTPYARPEPVEVTVDSRGGSTTDVRGVRWRLCALPREHTAIWQGRRLTSPERTFLDLAQVLELVDLVAVGDVILRRRLAAREDLAAMLAWAHRRRGVRRARRALELLDPKSRSPQESRVRAELAEAGLPTPEVCAIILDSQGGFLAEGDLVWRGYKVLVEYDGEVHLDERVRRKDAVRRNQVAQEGWLHLVYTADVPRTRIVSEVAAALASRGWFPETPC